MSTLRRGEKVFLAHDNPRNYIGDPMPYTYLEDMPEQKDWAQLVKVINPYGKIELVFKSELKRDNWDIDRSPPDEPPAEDGEAD